MTVSVARGLEVQLELGDVRMPALELGDERLHDLLAGRAGVQQRAGQLAQAPELRVVLPLLLRALVSD